jgi:hypothetical protein
MKLHRMILALVLLGGLIVAAVVGQTAEPTGIRMSGAASKFLDSLTAEQKEKATRKFDDPERINWNFVPLQDKEKKPLRKGLRLDEMTPEQRGSALALLKSGTSNDGYVKAASIMSLEGILKDVEKNGTNTRNSDWYFFTVFGTPSKTGKWGWRVEGHHLSLNFTIDSGKVVSATPAFFGANPAIVRDGDRKGRGILPESEELARELAQTFNDDQRKQAYREKAFDEIEQQKSAPSVGEPQGLPAAKMTDKQKEMLIKLVESYAHRLADDIAEIQLQQVRDASIDKIHFAFSGPLEDGKPSTYRVQGPNFVVEFLNVQADGSGNVANHIHSGWRGIKGDFGTEK